MKRRTFLHGSVPVEREVSKPGEWVSRGGDTPLDRWVQGERSLPRVVDRRNGLLAHMRLDAEKCVMGRRGCNGEPAAGSPSQKCGYYPAHLANRVTPNSCLDCNTLTPFCLTSIRIMPRKLGQKTVPSPHAAPFASVAKLRSGCLFQPLRARFGLSYICCHI
jgi:hypothetical protein